METQNNSCVIWVVAAVVISLVAGFFLDPYLPASVSNAKKGYTTGFDAARQIVEGSQYGRYFQTSDDVRFVSGTVVAIDDNRVIIRAQSANPFDDARMGDRTALITASTTISTFEMKDPATYQAELATFNKSSAAKATGAIPPSTSIKVSVDLKTITVGSAIVAIASENIKDMKEFTASELQLQSKLLFGK